MSASCRDRVVSIACIRSTRKTTEFQGSSKDNSRPRESWRLGDGSRLHATRLRVDTVYRELA